VIEDLIRAPAFRRYFPPVAGIIFVSVFLSLAFWQLDRAAEKKALLAMFDDDAPYLRVNDFSSLAEFSRIQQDGKYLPEKQVLIDNILREGRPGYYVITPFKPNNRETLLLVNRGWVPKSPTASAPLPELPLASNLRTIRGLAGRLPRVAIRPGEAFEGSEDWPRVAVYPRPEEMSVALSAELLPTVLLLAPDDEDGFVRGWEPNISGPATHYGYAFQWFAMAATVVALFIYHFRKRQIRD